MRHLTRTVLAALGATALVTVSACATNDADTTTDTTTDTASDAATDTATATGSAATTDPTEAVSETTTAAADGPSATLTDADGTELGTVQFTEADGTDSAVEVTASLSGMEPGFYGFHLHGAGVCETDSAAPDDPADTGDFLSAGGHLGSDEADHPDHAGDLPQLLVQNSGDASLSFTTDRITLADLEDEDGTAVIIHADPDNYANIPERYAADGPDEDTTGAGDAGDRLACGVIGR